MVVGENKVLDSIIISQNRITYKPCLKHYFVRIVELPAYALDLLVYPRLDRTHGRFYFKYITQVLQLGLGLLIVKLDEAKVSCSNLIYII